MKFGYAIIYVEMVADALKFYKEPSSPDGYKALLIEPEGVPNTGNVKNEFTIKNVEWI